MNFTPRLDNAIKVASHLHRFQTRNDAKKTPYISHLIAVAILVASATDDEDIIIAGLMHDALEDVPNYTYEQLVLDCGVRVAEIVKHVTEPLDANKEKDEQLPWLERKEAYLQSLKSGGVESALVSTADKIHNTTSFLTDAREEGEMFMSRFGSSIKNRLWFHEEVLAIVTEKLHKDHPLVQEFAKCTLEMKTFAEYE